MLREVLRNIRANLRNTLFIRFVCFGRSPSSSWMKRIPRRPLTISGLGRITMFSKAVADFHLVIHTG